MAEMPECKVTVRVKGMWRVYLILCLAVVMSWFSKKHAQKFCDFAERMVSV